MSNHKNLLFFNKEGDNLNFNYSDINDRFEGSIMFHENSNDTFKTAGIYTLEKIPSFEFEKPGEMYLSKFQLFNEFGFDFYEGKYFTQSVTKIEPINNDPNFYSKWIYGEKFDIFFPIGTIIRFNSSFLEFTNPLQTYTVVSVKKGAIMIISSVDNATFEVNYYNEYIYNDTYLGKSISAINAIGVYNYIDGSYKDNLSAWNEPSFYDKLYKRKKLNIINSEFNNKTVTVLEKEITDTRFFEYYTSNIDNNQDLIIEVASKTDLPKIYEGSLSFEYTAGTWSTPEINKLVFGGLVPQVLKSGREFKVIGSNNNQNFFTVASIPTFYGNSQQTFYDVKSQVLFNNKIYECIQAYTQSFALESTQFITPTNEPTYWTDIISHVKVDQQITPEFLSSCQVYLTTDKLYFSHGYTQSSQVTLASAAEKYASDLKSFNVELFYEKGQLKADLMYPSKYVEVNYYQGSVGPTYSIGNIKQTYERLIQVSEPLTKELNYNFSSNHSVNIVFTDLDEYGFKLIVNKQVFEEEIAWVYSGIGPDMVRTIDRTLRTWLTRNYINLQKLGIIADLQYIGSFTSPFYNSIKLHTEYPNVEMYVNDVKVGTTANYYIEHSKVLFNDMGSYLSLEINSDTYDQSTIYLTGTYSQYPNIPATLQAWVDEHGSYLANYGILVTNIHNLLKFDVKKLDRRLDYTITTGKSSLPGMSDYIITKKIKGNNGVVITSNEVRLPDSASGTYSFEDAGFATGMAFSINNTFHTWNNTEFNVQFLDPEVMNLSYQGPFWGTKDPTCNSSAFITLAFEIGFGQTACDPIIGPTGGSSGGPFNLQQFSSAFSLAYNPNVYTTNTYNLQQYNGTNNLVDISYVQLSNAIYAFGDEVVVMDAFLTDYLTNIPLPGNTQSKKMEFNPVNNYLYCVSNKIIYAIDPLINTVVKSMTFSNTSLIIDDVKFNTSNGDMYISFINSPTVDIYNSSNNYYTTLSGSTTNFPSGVVSTGKMAFNEFEGDMYIQTFGVSGQVIRVNTNRTIQTSYGISGLTGSLFYEPVNESVYAYDTSNLWKIDNGLTVSISGVSVTGFSDIIFNNLTGQMDLSDSSTAFRGIDLTTNNVGFTTYLGNYGYLVLNQYDGSVYMSSKGSSAIVVINPVDGTSLNINPMTSMTDRIIYNPERKSIWTIQPGLNSIIEVEVTLNSTITPEIVPSVPISEDNRYGTLNPDYVPHDSLWLKTKEYLRKPRENFSQEARVEYYWKWYSDVSPEFFIYDFSGTQLTNSGSYSYTGPKPLPTVVLNKKPNKDLTKLDSPEYQQTIFDEVYYPLSYIDDETNISTAPEPLELFLGFRADDEGAIRSILQLYKKEDVSLSINSTSTNNTFITLETLDPNGPDKRGLIKLNTNSSEYFTEKGLKEGQLIAVYIKDNMNKKNQYISHNNGSVFKIRSVFYKTLIVDFLGINDYLFTESTLISNYPTSGNTTYCKFDINVIDREIGRFITYGQTEIEDIRFKTELGNVGKLIAPNEVFIFKDYDVLEGGIDWTYLNKKRKEMLMMKHLIYPYIGAYKSIINAINFFGYNDLQLNEYYRNINPESEKFLKLFKQEIPDIFDNTVEGWTESDFITNNFPNDDYEETRMFNLTYNITDKDGNNIINYSIDEVIIKLQGLKYWLKRNIIPLTHKILDITGRAYFKNQTEITHTSYDIQMINIRQNMTPISFKLNEVYLMPINSGSTVYNCVIDFYSIVDGVGADKNPTGLLTPPKPFNGSNLDLPDYFDITIRTYKTYKEWAPFTTYNTGDKISYYGKLYESQVDGNKIKNPKKYENLTSWVSGGSYSVTTTVEYNRDVFVYSGLGTMSSTASSIIPPINDSDNWLKITEWKEINYEPVQTIKEFRKINKPDDTRVYPQIGGNSNPMPPSSIPIDSNTLEVYSPKGNNSNPILPFNFTIDSNIDPFIVIEVTSDNGYGLIYRDKKNYEIRGLKDLTEPTTYIDLIGPFQPITPIY